MSELDQEILEVTQAGIAQALGLPHEVLEAWNVHGKELLVLLNEKTGALLVPQLLDYMNRHKPNSPGGKTYRQVLDAFQTFMEGRWRGTPEDTWRVGRVTRRDVADFVTRPRLDGSRRSANTSNKELAIIRAFFEWMRDTDRGYSLVAKSVQRQKESEALPVALNADEQNTLLELCAQSKQGPRNYAMAFLVLNTGLRVSEVCSLIWDNFDFRTGWLRVVGKGGKERSIPILPAVAAVLAEYRQTYWRTQIFAPGYQNHLFRSQSGRHWGMAMTTKGAEEMLEPFMEALGRPKGQNFHVLRHTFAVNLLLAGVQIVYIKRILGHSLLETTNKYTKVADLDVARVMEKHFPEGVIVPRTSGRDMNPELRASIQKLMEE